MVPEIAQFQMGINPISFETLNKKLLEEYKERTRVEVESQEQKIEEQKRKEKSDLEWELREAERRKRSTLLLERIEEAKVLLNSKAEISKINEEFVKDIMSAKENKSRKELDLKKQLVERIVLVDPSFTENEVTSKFHVYNPVDKKWCEEL